MQNQKIKRNVADYFVIVLLALFMLFSAGLPGALTGSVRAEGIEYTSALEDLQQDESFNAEDYSVIENDYSPELITVAESTNKELFIYVYQPYGNYNATSLNMSLSSDSVDFLNYGLVFINNSSVFYKYKVDSLEVGTDTNRTYEISSIFRPWLESIDESVGGDNTISEVAFAVGKKFVFSADSVTVTEFDLIDITDKFVGFVRYVSGSNFWGATDSCDSHFVAFSTDKNIDNLLQADVYFRTQTVRYQVNYNDWRFGEIEDNYSYITDTDAVFYQSEKSFWYNYAYEWQRIQTLSDFVGGEDFSTLYKSTFFNVQADYKLTEQGLTELSGKEWVLRFFESEYVFEPGMYGGVHYSTRVSDVSILKLKFETAGNIYELGVVDNKQTGSDEPVNEVTLTWSLADWLQALLYILLAVLVVVLLLVFAPGVIPAILRFLWFVLKYFFIGLWYLIKYIAIGIYWLFAWPFYLFKKDS